MHHSHEFNIVMKLMTDLDNFRLNNSRLGLPTHVITIYIAYLTSCMQLIAIFMYIP